MNSSDDPHQKRPTSCTVPAHRNVPARVSVTWSAAARSEYSRLVEATPASRRTLVNSLRRAVRATLGYAQQHGIGLPIGAPQVDVSLVADEEIMQLNADYRNKNGPTDVLSFAQCEGESFIFAAEGAWLGDVVIAVATAVRQARRQEHDLRRELEFLAVHGTLHLCGFDHDTTARRRILWRAQDEITARLAR